MTASYVVHVLSAAAWTGGLPALAFAAAERRDEGRYNLLARYSATAIGAVSLIIISGVANTIFHAGSFRQLAASIYGLVLLTKFGLLAAMLTVALLNRFVIMPQLRNNSGPEQFVDKLR